VTKDMMDVLQIACVSNLEKFMTSCYLNTINDKRVTLMEKDFKQVVEIASDPSTHLVAKDMYHDGVRKINQANRNRLPDA